MLPTKFRYIWPNSFRGEEFLKSAKQKQESLVAAMFVNGLGGMSNLYRGPSIDASYQVSVHFAKRLQKRRIFKISQSETRVACGGHVCKQIGTKWAMRAFHRFFLPSFRSFGWGVLETYLSVIQFIANCILLIFIFKLELFPFPQKNRFFSESIQS